MPQAMTPSILSSLSRLIPFRLIPSMGRITVFAVVSLVLAACSNNEVILPGERIDISAYDEQILSVNESAASEGIAIGDDAVNLSFDAPGQNAGHSGGHFSVDLPLQQVFSTRVGIAAEEGTEIAQPVADEKAVYTVTPGGIVTAVSATDGAVLWRVDIDPSTDETQTSVSGGIALSSGHVIAHASKKTLVSLYAETGAENWRKDFDVFLSGGPTPIRNIIIVTDLDGRIYALSAEDGGQLWNRIGAQDSTRIAGASFPAAFGNDIVASGGDGEIQVLNIEQGDFLWGENLTPVLLRTALDAIPDLRAHPVHDGGLVVVVTPSAQIFAFNASTGRQVWQMPLHAPDMPWVSGESLFLTTIDGRLYVLRRNDGAIRWVTELPGAYDPSLAVNEDAVRYTTPLLVSGKVLIGSSRGYLMSFDASTGVADQQFSTGQGITTAPLVANKTVFVISRSGVLYAYR